MKIKILTSFVVSTVFFFSVSGMVCVSQKANKLLKDFWIFDADYPAYTEVFTRAKPWRPSPLHILINVVWRPPTVLLSRVLDASLGDEDRAGLFASRILLATISAVGIAALVRIAAQLGVEGFKAGILFPMFLLATSNVVASLPESYGLSLGLLAVTSSVILSDMDPRRKAVLLAFLCILCGGTTITNVLDPGGALVYLVLLPRQDGGIRPPWLTPARIRLLWLIPLLASLASLALLPLIKRSFPGLYSHLFSWLHLKIIRQPVLALRAGVDDLILPVVAPYPCAGGRDIIYRSPDGLAWTWVHIVSACTWGMLLVRGAVEGLRGPELRSYTLGLLGWIGFNLALHSIWGGPDHGLYMPHWSWTLLTLVSLGARGMRTRSCSPPAFQSSRPRS